MIFSIRNGVVPRAALPSTLLFFWPKLNVAVFPEAAALHQPALFPHQVLDGDFPVPKDVQVIADDVSVAAARACDEGRARVVTLLGDVVVRSVAARQAGEGQLVVRRVRGRWPALAGGSVAGRAGLRLGGRPPGRARDRVGGAERRGPDLGGDEGWSEEGGGARMRAAGRLADESCEQAGWAGCHDEGEVVVPVGIGRECRFCSARVCL